MTLRPTPVPCDEALSHRWQPNENHMQDYRAYIIGPDGHIKRRVDLICKDESAAQEQAKQLVDGHDVELWQGATGQKSELR